MRSQPPASSGPQGGPGIACGDGHDGGGADANIAAHLTRMAKLVPQQKAVIEPTRSLWGHLRYKSLTYAQLDAESNLVARGLRADGLAAGMRVVVMVPPSLEFFVLTFALFKARLIPVFIDPGMGRKHLKRCLVEAEPHAFIGSAKAHVARILLGWCHGRSLYVVKVGGWTPLFGVRPLAQIKALGAACTGERFAAAEDGDRAAILFTSGSTGSPKGAFYQHRQFNAQIKLLRSSFSITPGEIDLCTFPLFGLFAPALGMTAVIPEMDFTRPAKVNPKRIYAAVGTFNITTMFGSPALLRRVALDGVRRGVKLPSLKRVISAGAPVSPKILQEFGKLLAPGVKIFTPYGATESLPVAVTDSGEILAETGKAGAHGRGVCVGRPVQNTDVGVLAITDAVIATLDAAAFCAQGVIGEIVVRGDQVTPSYFGRSEADLAAKIVDSRDGSLWHRMGDLGYFDGAGRLWFCGRKSHRVKTAVQELYTDPIEGVFNSDPAVYRSALVGRGRFGDMTPVLCVEPQERLRRGEKQNLRSKLLTLARSTKETAAVQEIQFFTRLPVDTRHNTKIFREQLKLKVDRRQGRNA